MLVAALNSSGIEFQYNLDGLPQKGRFQKFTSQLSVDQETGKPIEIITQIDVRSIDVDLEDAKDMLPLPQWFAVEQFPLAEFKTLEIYPKGGNQYIADAELRVKGVSHRVNFEFSFEQTEKESGSLTGQALIDRSAYQIGTDEWDDEETIKHAVKIMVTIDYRAIK